jgi:integrase
MARLTERAVQTAKPGRHGDGDGLMLVVAGSGRKTWVMRYQIAGKRRDKGLGSYPEVSLKEARELAGEDRKRVARGLDPIDEGRKAKQALRPLPTFRDIAALVVADAQAKSVNAKCRYHWERYLGPAYCAPLIDQPVHAITTLDVAAVLRPVWRAKPEAARKLYPAIRRVFERARIVLRDEHGVAMPGNPALWGDLKVMGFEAPKALTRGHHPSLPHERMAEFIAALRMREGVAALALEFLILTNLRTDAVLKARWPEFNLDQAIWTVPLANLKDREHRTEAFEVPLAARAVAILQKLAPIQNADAVFPGRNARKPLAGMALLTLVRRMNEGPSPAWIDPVSGRAITPHGFRASFRTWAEEVATFPHAAIEHAMGHRVGDKVERAYNRTTLIAIRRNLMDAWAAYVEPKAASPVVSLAERLKRL